MVLHKLFLFDVEHKYQMPKWFGVLQLMIAGIIGCFLHKLFSDVFWFVNLAELVSINFIKALTSPLTFILFCCFFDLVYSHRNAFKIAVKTMIFIITTTCIATTFGFVFAWYLNPLSGIDLSAFTASASNANQTTEVIPFVISGMFFILEFTKTAFLTLAKYSELSILYILLAAIIPVILLHTIAKKYKKADTVLNSLGRLNQYLLGRIVLRWLKLVVSLLPIAMCFIIAWFLNSVDPTQLEQYGGMLAGNVASIFTQQVFLLIILSFVVGFWVLRYAFTLLPVYFTALCTRSSVATMKITMSYAEYSGISKMYREFVIPFGATVNMNGTATHVSFWVCGLAFALHPDLNVLSLWLYVMFYITLTAMGTAAIPGGSIALLKKAAPAVFAAAIGSDIPESQMIGLIALITVFDIVADAVRTQANVFGDTMCLAWLEKNDPKTKQCIS